MSALPCHEHELVFAQPRSQLFVDNGCADLGRKITALNDAARWIERKATKHKAGICGPDLTGLGVLANDRNHLGILTRSHKCGPYIGLELTRVGRLIGDYIAIGGVGGGSDGEAEAGRQRQSEISLQN